MRYRTGLALTALLFIIGANSQGAAKDLNFGWPSGEDWSSQPYKVTMERGFFEKEGLKVRVITFRGTNLMLAALMSGDLDYMTILPISSGAMS